jgi:hypothetical protein
MQRAIRFGLGKTRAYSSSVPSTFRAQNEAAISGFSGLCLESKTQEIDRPNHQHAVFLEPSGAALGICETLDLRKQSVKGVRSRVCEPAGSDKVKQHIAGYATIDCLSVLIALK